MSVSAPVTNISRCSLHDGPGVRTVVYLAGCSLRCQWCHNPETFSKKPQLLYTETKCIHCARCARVCPEHHKIDGGSLRILSEGCTACGRCTEVCPTNALSLSCRMMRAEEVFEEIKKDAHYYKASGGGVTFSGGECLLQPEFVGELAAMCKSAGINTTVESAFCVPFANVEAILPAIDLFFADLKLPFPEKHRLYTGKDNSLILENIRRLSMLDTEIIVRIPVIPGVNDSDEDLRGFADILKTLGSAIRQVELLKYNNLAGSKYSLLGLTYTDFSREPQSDERMQALCAALSEACGIVCTF